MKIQEIADKLRSTQLFSGLDGLESIIEAYPPCEKSLLVGEKYESKNTFVLICKGKADIVKETESKTAYMKTVEAPSMTGLATLFSTEDEYISTLIAKQNTLLLIFSEGFIRELIATNSEFSLRLITLLCQKVRYLNKRIDFYTCPGTEQKLHEFLLRSCDSDGRVEMSMSRVSDTLGMGRASLYRALAALEEKGFIIKDGKKIQLIK